MVEFFASVGATVREVMHLDLEETFVELLRAARAERRAGESGEERVEPALAGVMDSVDTVRGEEG